MNRRSDKPALRPATIPEQAAWRPLSVKRELQTENWPASANTDDTGPEDYILELGRVLISAQAKCRLGCAVQRPLLGVKRTWRGLVSMSAYDPKRTFVTSLQKALRVQLTPQFISSRPNSAKSFPGCLCRRKVW